jgi:lipid A 4'-phosphatase
MFGVSKVFIAVFVACSLLLALVPQIDLWFSSLFYDPDLYGSGHGGFPCRNNHVALVVYEVVRYTSRVLPLALVAGLVATLVRKRALFGFGTKAYAYLLAVFVIGDIIIINAVLKNGWARARPDETPAFGGDRRFTPAFVIAGQRRINGSWPSGHATLGFYFVAVGMLLRKRRTVAIAAAGALGGLIGLARIVQGRHFLSDVVSAFFIMYIVARVLYWVMYESRFWSRWRWPGSS